MEIDGNDLNCDKVERLRLEKSDYGFTVIILKSVDCEINLGNRLWFYNDSSFENC